MCALCKKINVVKDILNGYFTDEELDQMNQDIGLPGYNLKGARLSICLMAIIELCVEQGLSEQEIHDGVQVAIVRDVMRRHIEANFPDSKHSVRERMEGYES
jgi:hypothetical protein